jgi:hypothetical protein
MRTALFALPLAAMFVTGCAVHVGNTTYAPRRAEAGSGVLTVSGHASADRTNELLGRVKRLAGNWEMREEDGSWKPTPVISVGSGGSSVREVMFPGGGHEMTNMYHMDGDSLVVTHYCAVGNQPRMRCRGAVMNADGSVSLPFAFDAITNLGDAEGMYMGEMTLRIIDDNNIEQIWRHTEKGKVGEPMTFVLRRRA